MILKYCLDKQMAIAWATILRMIASLYFVNELNVYVGLAYGIIIHRPAITMKSNWTYGF